MDGLSISELAARTGVQPSTLRFYERKEVIPAARRVGGGRRYDERAVEQVALVSLLKRAGFTLAEIATLVGSAGRTAADWRPVALAKLLELDQRLHEIRQVRAALQRTIEAPHNQLDDCPVHRRILRAHAEALATAARTARRARLP